MIIECRRYTTSKQSQEKLGSLAYRIQDTGASGGIIVSPLGIQKGAALIASKENIISVQLDANCTPTDFVMKFLNKIMVGISESMVLSDTVTMEVTRSCKNCGQRFVTQGNETICATCRSLIEPEQQ